MFKRFYNIFRSRQKSLWMGMCIFLYTSLSCAMPVQMEAFFYKTGNSDSSALIELNLANCNLHLHSFNTFNGIQLNWTSDAKYCATAYEVEKWDGKEFVLLALIESKDDADLENTSYVFEDPIAEAGANVYRIKVLCNYNAEVVSSITATVLAGSENEIPPYLSAAEDRDGYLKIYSSYHAEKTATFFVFNKLGDVVATKSVAFGKNGEAKCKIGDMPLSSMKLAVADDKLNQAVTIR